MILESEQYQKATIKLKSIVVLFLRIIPFLGGKYICLHVKSRYK